MDEITGNNVTWWVSHRVGLAPYLALGLGGDSDRSGLGLNLAGDLLGVRGGGDDRREGMGINFLTWAVKRVRDLVSLCCND